MKKNLTGTQIDRLLTYNPAVGEFYWKRGRGGQAAGSRAGHLQAARAANGAIKKYWTIRIHNQAVRASVLAWVFMTGQWPENEIDHEDGDSTNDRFSNLRPATHAENCRNSKKRNDNCSGFKGVSWDSFTGRWVVRIRVPNGKYENLGRFDDAREGHSAYQRRAVELYGKFARFA